MPVALMGHGGGGNCANGIAVKRFQAGIEHGTQRKMHLAEDEVVRLVHTDLNSRFVEVLAV